MEKNSVTEHTTQRGLPRRGFFAALGAAVAGGFGAGSILRSWTDRRISMTPADEPPVVTVHPSAIARNEEGSPRHG